MSKLKQPSVSDSFNAPKNQPDNPNGMNWKQMLFQLLLAFVAGGTFGTIMHFSNKNLLGKATEKDEEKILLAALNAAKIQSQLTAPAKEEIKPQQIMSESKKVDTTGKV